ncbi:hypothetical protein GGQ90_005814, partial [Sphingobium scionense]|nr:hypothetical protein [Sphingobium scionense]
ALRKLEISALALPPCDDTALNQTIQL